MATTQEPTQAEQHWLEAKKIAHAMQKKLERISKDESGSKKLLADLEAMEHMLESLRLACMATTFTDFKFAHKNRVLDRLWSLHTAINAEYKKGLQRHRSHNQFVQLRNVERQYAKHLKTAQYFYRGFIERLSARYQLRALQRVAHTLQADGSTNLQVDEVIDAEQADLSCELTVACYRTILHMGDLSRYRMNAARQKSHSRHNPDMAMTYYALAQDLMPQEGDAHHQMAVVMAEQRKDFDVVYHFLRAWSVQRPFALAPTNLASEFKKLLQAPSAASRKNGAAPPSLFDTFGSWIVRLHANYFRGEEFSSQGELEREVLHRWEALLKAAEQPQCLQKAVLMNFALYDIVSKKVADEWTEAGSRSCRFALLFIVRSFLVLSRVLEPEIDRLLEVPDADERDLPSPSQTDSAPAAPAAAPAAAPEGNGKQAQKTNGKAKPGEGNRNNNRRGGGRRNGAVGGTKCSPPGTCLSLFRIYMAWLSLHYADLVKFQEHLQPYITDMHRSVTRCLSRCIALVADTDAASAPYLLPEDVEIIGLTPLHDWPTLRAAPDDSTAYKPRFDEACVERFDATHETLARVYDVVDAAVRLLGTNSLPWVTAKERDGERDLPRIYYNQDYEPPAESSQPFSASHCGAVVADVLPVASPPKSRDHGTKQLSPPSAPTQAPLAASGQADPWEFGVPGTSGSSAGPVSAGTTQPLMAPPPLPAQARQWQSRLAPSVNYKEMDDMDDFLPGSMKEPMVQRVGNIQAAPDGGADSDLDQMGAETLKRIQNFLNPPEARHPPTLPASENAPYMQSTSSYGMHSATADSVFGQLQTPSPAAVYYAPTSGTPIAGHSNGGNPTTPAAGNPIPSSPWNRVYTPSSSSYYRTLQAAYGLGIEGAEKSGGHFPPPAGSGRMGPSGGNLATASAWQPANIEEQLAFLTLAKQQQREFSAAPAASTAPAAASRPSTSSAAMDPFGTESHGSLPSFRGFPSALSPVGTAKVPASPPGGGSGFRNPWGSPGAPSSGHHSSGSAPQRLLPQQLQQAQAASLGLLGPSSGGGGGGAAASSLYGSSNFDVLSSMPSVQSPRGLPGQQQKQQQQQQQQQASPQRDLYSSQDAFGGHYAQPALAPSQPYAMQPSLSSGSLGDTAATGGAGWGGRNDALGRDNSMLFRTAVRQTGFMEDTNTYDRNALLSALYDDGRSSATGGAR